jgi:hypothetical protein
MKTESRRNGCIGPKAPFGADFSSGQTGRGFLIVAARGPR